MPSPSFEKLVNVTTLGRFLANLDDRFAPKDTTMDESDYITASQIHQITETTVQDGDDTEY